jgi:hypothetical protein
MTCDNGSSTKCSFGQDTVISGTSKLFSSFHLEQATSSCVLPILHYHHQQD